MSLSSWKRVKKLRKPSRPFEPYIPQSGQRGDADRQQTQPIAAVQQAYPPPFPAHQDSTESTAYVATESSALRTWLHARPWWQWAAGVASVLILAGGAVLMPGLLNHTEKQGKDSGSLFSFPDEKGKLTGGTLELEWEKDKGIRWRAAVTTTAMLVAVECGGSIEDRNADCLIRGRDLNSGDEAWAIRNNVGKNLLAIEDSVVSYGGVDAETLVIRTTDGHVAKRLPDASLVARNDRIVVFDVDVADDENFGKRALIGVQPDGTEVWRHTYEGGSLTIGGDMNLPQGFDVDDAHYHARSHFASVEGDDIVAHAVNDGHEVGRLTDTEQAPIGIFGETLVTATFDDGGDGKVAYSAIHGYRLEQFEEPLWTKSGSFTTGTTCARYVCFTDAERGGLLLDPSSGNELAHNAKGLIMAREEGNTAVLQFCDWVQGSKSLLNLCPPETAETRIVDTSDFTELWRGGGLVFVGDVTGSEEVAFLVGLADEEKKSMRIIAARRGLKPPIELGATSREGMLHISDIQGDATRLAESAGIAAIPNARCAATAEAVYCGAIAQEVSVGKWGYAVQH